MNCRLLVVEMSGLEPPTPTLSGWCSNQLSYISILTCLFAFTLYRLTAMAFASRSLARLNSVVLRPAELHLYIDLFAYTLYRLTAMAFASRSLARLSRLVLRPIELRLCM